MTQLWQGGARGQGITIAEIDTGVNASLPELAGNVLVGTDFGQPPATAEPTARSTSSGTAPRWRRSWWRTRACSSITGIAPDAKILPIAVPLTGTTDAGAATITLPRRSGRPPTTAARSSACRWAAPASRSHGRVPCPEDEQAAIYYALNKGAVLLASSGNTGLTGNAVEEPGVCLGVISVGAVDQNNVAADFSARHPYLTLTAPGVNVPA